MSKLKLVEVMPDLGNGGAERFVFDICRLVDRVKFDLTLILLYNGNNSKYYDQLVKMGVNIICLNKHRGLDLKCFSKMIKAIKSINPDVIHTHQYVNFYLLPYYLTHKKQIGYHTVHSVADKEQVNRNKKIMNYLYHHRNVTPVAIGKTVLDSIVNMYHINEDKVKLIYNGIDTSKFAKKVSYSENLSMEFIATGRFFEVKNYALMLDAFAKVVDKYHSAKLTILGDGELRDTIEKRIEELRLSANVTLAGNVPNVQDYLAKADCFIMSSDYEGLPLSVLESMSVGLPIVSTKAGGVVDIVQDNVNGYLSDVGDTNGLANNIIRIIEQNKFREFGEKSYELSRQYDIRDCVKEYEELFTNEFV